jgi:hypothetical protein
MNCGLDCGLDFWGVQTVSPRKEMVGPWGLEPQTSTVSICGPRDYGLLLKATNLLFCNEITWLWHLP